MKANWLLKCKAIALLVLVICLQVATVLRALHQHESVCLLDSSSYSGLEVLHAHADDHDNCAWAGFHFSACTVTFPLAFTFLPFTASFIWSEGNFDEPTSFFSLPFGRGPPSVLV